MTNPGRYNKIDYPGLLGSFIVSWILHAILFFIAATTTIFYPPTASREYISVDLMFASPGSQPADLPQQINTNSPSPPTAARQSVADSFAAGPEPAMTAKADTSSDLELLKVALPKTEKKIVLAKKTPPVAVRKPVQKVKPPPPAPVIIPAVVKTAETKDKEAVKPVEVAPPPDLAVQAKAVEQTEQEKLAIENEKIRRQQEAASKAAQLKAEEEAKAEERARTAELKRQEAEKERIHKQQLAEEQAAREKAREEAQQAALAKALAQQKRQAEKAAKAKLAAEKAKKEREAAENARREQQTRLKLAAEKSAREKMARERAAAEKAAQEAVAKARLTAVYNNEKNVAKAAAANSGISASTAGSQSALAASGEHREKPLTAMPAANANKSQLKNRPERKGFALPPVAGDIKLIITSPEDLVVKALFVSHPRANHDKPLSKKEAKVQQKLTPIVVRTAENILEAVIERSQDGIYIFLVEPKGGKPVQGKFAIKLFETRDKPIKGQEISGQREVARLLMPEGILWEDDSAFSGNIEDSDSVTKFNSDTGLVWKEYHR